MLFLFSWLLNTASNSYLWLTTELNFFYSTQFKSTIFFKLKNIYLEGIRKTITGKEASSKVGTKREKTRVFVQ